MKMQTLEDLFQHELKDLYSAEKQLLKALPKMAKAATNEDLKAAFEQHLEETQTHAERLEGILEQFEISTARVPKCKAMEGLVAEGKEVLEADMDEEVRDAALISCAQRVEHYEMAGYGCARTFAQRLGHDDVAEILQTTLDEEGATDKRLTEIAENWVNQAAQS